MRTFLRQGLWGLANTSIRVTSGEGGYVAVVGFKPFQIAKLDMKPSWMEEENSQQRSGLTF